MGNAGNDATLIFRGLQVGKGNHPTYRKGMTLYVVMQDTTAAYSRALANPQYGPGGSDQYVIPNYQTVLQPVFSLILNNR